MHYMALEGLRVVRKYFKKNVGVFNGYDEMVEGLPGRENSYICITFKVHKRFKYKISFNLCNKFMRLMSLISFLASNRYLER